MDDCLEQLMDGHYYKKFQEMAYDELLQKFELTLLELQVILFLSEHEHSDRPVDILHTRHIAKSHLSRSIDELIQRGFLEKRVDKQDKRYIHLQLTPVTQNLVKTAHEQQRQLIKTIFAGVTMEEREILQQTSAKIVRNISNSFLQWDPRYPKQQREADKICN